MLTIIVYETHIVIVYINAVWPTINEPGRRRSYVKSVGGNNGLGLADRKVGSNRVE
jgi:hypothetical protein